MCPQVYTSPEKELVSSLNFTLDTTEYNVTELLPETKYEVSMAFVTRCCTSEYGEFRL